MSNTCLAKAVLLQRLNVLATAWEDVGNQITFFHEKLNEQYERRGTIGAEEDSIQEAMRQLDERASPVPEEVDYDDIPF